MSPTEIEIKNIDHLGLIAGIIDELKIVENINEMLGTDPREKLNSGQIVKAIILNGLGFVSQPLYLFHKFFESKSTEHLLGVGIKSQDLNDDKIGRTMDKLYHYSLEQIFSNIALETVKKYKINTKCSHLDSSSICLQGKYEQSSTETENIINITYGYSRDHRPDLKQFMIDLISSSDGDIPLYFTTGSGNEQDKVAFGQITQTYLEKIDFDTMIVGDSALYTPLNLQYLKSSKWLSRVPFTIKKAQELAKKINKNQLIKSRQDGYSFSEIKINHHGINQRWLLVESEARQKSDLEKLEKKIEKEREKIEKKLVNWSRKKIPSLPEAKLLVKQLNKQLKFYQLESVKYHKSRNKSQEKVYSLEGIIKENSQKIEEEKNRAGRFVLATNVLDEQELSSEEMLSEYKQQQCCERGFRFLKDPQFFADSIFIKNAHRVETMAMLMALCLLVYSISQRLLRQQLISSNSLVKNQVGKLTNRPTTRWIFQCFQGIHLLIIKGAKQIVNLTSEKQSILKIFPIACQKYYILSG